MKNPSFFFISMLFFILLFSLGTKGAFARQRTLFQFRDFRQWLELSYQFDDFVSENGHYKKGSQHTFEETYRFSLNYAIYSRGLLNGELGMGLGLTQGRSDDNDQGTENDFGDKVMYHLTGTLLEKKPYPLQFTLNNQSQRVTRRFTSNYDQKSTNQTVGLSLGNNFLPATINFTHSELETDGLEEERREETSSLTLSAFHTYKNFSHTRSSVSFNTTETELTGRGRAGKTDSVNFRIQNVLEWRERGLTRSLGSRFDTREETGNREHYSYHWAEELDWDLGKALRSRLIYQNELQRTSGEERSSHYGEGWVEHRLFKSLTTLFKLRAQHDDFEQGTQDNFTGNANLFYRKHFRTRNLFQTELSHSYGITDRDLKEDHISVFDERFVVDPTQPYYLRNPDVLAESIVVRSPTGFIVYQEGRDYTIQQVGRWISIDIPLFTSAILPDDVVSVDYQYMINPSIRFSTSTTRVSASTSFRENRYRVFGSITTSSQDFLEGRQNIVRLNSSDVYRLGGEINFPNWSFGSEYVFYDSNLARYHSLDNFWQYIRRFKSHTLSVNLRDIYKRYLDADGSEDEEGSENTFGLTNTYKKSLSRKSFLKASADYLHFTGRFRDQQNILFTLRYQTQVKRLAISLYGETKWRIFEDFKSREDLVRLDLIRYF